MAVKRGPPPRDEYNYDYEDDAYGDGSESGLDAPPTAKRQKRTGHQSKRQRNNPVTDPVSGQRYAFPGKTTIPNDVDSEFEYEDDAEAMQYLRAVREEAGRIPAVLIEQRYGPSLPLPGPGEQEEGDGVSRDIYSSGAADFRAYYEDGAYIAAPSDYGDDDGGGEGIGSGLDEEEREALAEASREAAIQAGYHSALLSQFLALRATLHAKPPPSLVHALDRAHSWHVGPLGARNPTFGIWNRRLRETDPLPAQVACMDRQAVLRVLRVLLAGRLLRRGSDMAERTSRWLWALMARLPDRGEMSHVEVGWIRDLGRRAVLLTTSLAEMAALREQVERGRADLGMHDDVDDGSGSGSDSAEVAEGAEKVGGSEPGEDIGEGGGDADKGEDAEDDNGAVPMDLSDGEIDEMAETAAKHGGGHGDDDAGEVDDAGEINGMVGTSITDGDGDSRRRDGKTDGVGGMAAETPVNDEDDYNIRDEIGGQGDEQLGTEEVNIDETRIGAGTAPDKDRAHASSGVSLEAAKARLLGQLEQLDDGKEATVATRSPPSHPARSSEGKEEEGEGTAEDQDEDGAVIQVSRARMNMRATLTMILTVAGELYGQRDLLEFRDPFGGI